MSLGLRGEEKRLCFALSGGAFRAAPFQLAVFRKLHELTFAESYDRQLDNEAKLDNLKTDPRVRFNATNQSTGNLFFFVVGSADKSEPGAWELDQSPAGDFLVGEAVAASSAFPPVFPPSWP